MNPDPLSAPVGYKDTRLKAGKIGISTGVINIQARWILPPLSPNSLPAPMGYESARLKARKIEIYITEEHPLAGDNTGLTHSLMRKENSSLTVRRCYGNSAKNPAVKLHVCLCNILRDRSVASPARGVINIHALYSLCPSPNIESRSPAGPGGIQGLPAQRGKSWEYTPK